MQLFLRLISSPWFWVDIILSVTGGLLVWWGLKLEKAAEKVPNLDALVDDERKRRELGERGWRILMGGIVFEVLAAFGISVISGLEIADLSEKTENLRNQNIKLEAEVQRSDPLKQPINSVSAKMRLRVRGVNATNVWSHPTQGVFMRPEETTRADSGGLLFLEGTNTSKAIYRLSCGPQHLRFFGPGLVAGSNDWRGVTVFFHEDELGDFNFPLPFISNRFEIGQKVETFNNVGSVVISLPDMETNVLVVDGVIELKVNSSRWKFPIPEQRQWGGYMTTQMVTNGVSKIEAQILPVTIVDWVSPARFPNHVFDGK